MYKQYRVFQYFLVLADVAIVLAVLMAMVKLRPFLPGKVILPGDAGFWSFWELYLTIPLLYHIVFAMTHVYALSRLPFFQQQLVRLLSAYFLAVLVCAGFLYFVHRDVSRLLIIYFSVTALVGIVALRFFMTRYLLRRHGTIRRTNLVIVGSTENSFSVAREILDQYGSVYNLIGLVDSGDGFAVNLPAPLIGTAEDLPRLITENNVELVLIALPEGRYKEAEKLILALYVLPVRIYLIPDVLELTLRHSEVETFAGVTVIGIREPVIQGVPKAVKRLFDIAVASLVVLVGWPLALIISIAIKLDSPGPVLFRARRIGENGRLFAMLKFRTMIVGADKQQDAVVRLDSHGRPIYKLADDPRVTRVGKWLRRWSLDELPQLINVIKGEMSIVGPRPEQVFITEDYDTSQWPRLSVPPGITGWWQVSGRSDLPMHLNTQYDLYYVRNYSFLLDLKIILKTIGVVIRGRGAY